MLPKRTTGSCLTCILTLATCKKAGKFKNICAKTVKKESLSHWLNYRFIYASKWAFKKTSWQVNCEVYDILDRLDFCGGKGKKEEMNGRIACTFFSRKRQKGEEVESFAFEYLGGLSGLLCTTPTVYSRVQRVVSGSRLCKLGVFFHAPAELLPSSFLYTHF